jgi:hypothetical protein
MDYRKLSSRSPSAWMKLSLAVGLLLCNISWAFSPSFSTCRSGHTSLCPLPRHFPLAPSLLMTTEKSDLEDVDVDVDDSTIDEEEIDIDSVSDAEALLACRAYLQRKNRLGEWTQSKQRKRLREQAARDLQDSSWGSDSTGFFWEDPSELKYFNRKPVAANASLVEVDDYDVESEEEEKEEDEEDEGKLWENLSPRRVEHRIEYHDTDIEQEEEDLRLQGLEDYSAFDTEPSPSRVRRSKAAKLIWSDPEFRAKWYEKRWGTPSEFSAKEKQQKRLLKKRLSAFQPDILLANKELVNLSEEEIADAIRTYMVSKRRRSKSTKLMIQKRKEALRTPNPVALVPRDSLLTQDPEVLREAKRRRSEKSKKAYASRLKNRDQGSKTNTASADTRSLAVRKASVSTAATPRDALLRMQIDLEEGNLPQVTDVKLVLQPRKLGKRKVMLRRILSDHFDLRGLCVPADLDRPEDSEMIFATQCRIEQLGEFVIHKLLERT